MERVPENDISLTTSPTALTIAMVLATNRGRKHTYFEGINT
jgi:hypothetical protein